jgi:hypothetical protein
MKRRHDRIAGGREEGVSGSRLESVLARHTHPV